MLKLRNLILPVLLFAAFAPGMAFGNQHLCSTHVSNALMSISRCSDLSDARIRPITTDPRTSSDHSREDMRRKANNQQTLTFDNESQKTRAQNECNAAMDKVLTQDFAFNTHYGSRVSCTRGTKLSDCPIGIWHEWMRCSLNSIRCNITSSSCPQLGTQASNTSAPATPPATTTPTQRTETQTAPPPARQEENRPQQTTTPTTTNQAQTQTQQPQTQASPPVRIGLFNDLGQSERRRMRDSAEIRATIVQHICANGQGSMDSNLELRGCTLAVSEVQVRNIARRAVRGMEQSAPIAPPANASTSEPLSEAAPTAGRQCECPANIIDTAGQHALCMWAQVTARPLECRFSACASPGVLLRGAQRCVIEGHDCECPRNTNAQKCEFWKLQNSDTVAQCIPMRCNAGHGLNADKTRCVACRSDETTDGSQRCVPNPEIANNRETCERNKGIWDQRNNTCNCPRNHAANRNGLCIAAGTPCSEHGIRVNEGVRCTFQITNGELLQSRGCVDSSHVLRNSGQSTERCEPCPEGQIIGDRVDVCIADPGAECRRTGGNWLGERCVCSSAANLRAVNNNRTCECTQAGFVWNLTTRSCTSRADNQAVQRRATECRNSGGTWTDDFAGTGRCDCDQARGLRFNENLGRCVPADGPDRFATEGDNCTPCDQNAFRVDGVPQCTHQNHGGRMRCLPWRLQCHEGFIFNQSQASCVAVTSAEQQRLCESSEGRWINNSCSCGSRRFDAVTRQCVGVEVPAGDRTRRESGNDDAREAARKEIQDIMHRLREIRGQA